MMLQRVKPKRRRPKRLPATLITDAGVRYEGYVLIYGDRDFEVRLPDELELVPDADPFVRGIVMEEDDHGQVIILPWNVRDRNTGTVSSELKLVLI